MNIIEDPADRERLQKLVAVAGEHAHNVLIKAGIPMLMPTWAMLDEEENLSIVGTPWEDDVEKVAAEVVVRAFIAKHRIVAYSFVVEAWMAVKPKGWRPETGPWVRPANDPERREIVMAFATDGKIQEFRTWSTQRDAAGKIRELTEERSGVAIANENYRALFGWMTNLFEEEE